MKLSWALFATVADIVLAQTCSDPYDQFANTDIVSWKGRPCTNFDKDRTCTTKCLDGYIQALPVPLNRRATKITCTCDADNVCQWKTRKPFGNCFKCQKGQKVRQVEPSFKVLKDYGEDDLFDNGAALKMRTRMVNKETETLDGWTIAVVFDEPQSLNVTSTELEPSWNCQKTVLLLRSVDFNSKLKGPNKPYYPTFLINGIRKSDLTTPVGVYLYTSHIEDDDANCYIPNLNDHPQPYCEGPDETTTSASPTTTRSEQTTTVAPKSTVSTLKPTTSPETTPKTTQSTIAAKTTTKLDNKTQAPTSKPTTTRVSTTTATPIDLTCTVLTETEYSMGESGYWQDFDGSEPINHHVKYQFRFQISNAAEAWSVKVVFPADGIANTWDQTKLTSLTEGVSVKEPGTGFELGGKWPVQAGQQEIVVELEMLYDLAVSEFQPVEVSLCLPTGVSVVQQTTSRKLTTTSVVTTTASAKSTTTTSRKPTTTSAVTTTSSDKSTTTTSREPTTTSTVTTTSSTKSTTTTATTLECQVLPTGSYEVIENGYWNDWVDGQMATHAFKHKFVIEVSESVEEWHIKATYPYAVDPDTWSQTELEPAEGSSEQITIIGRRAVVSGQKIEQEVQLTVDINVGDYNKEDFYPLEVSACLPEGVTVPVGDAGSDLDDLDDLIDSSDNSDADADSDADSDAENDPEDTDDDDHTPKDGFTCHEVAIDSSVTETGAWQDGWADGKPQYHVFKHKFTLPLTEPAVSWYVHVHYPHPLIEIDTWGNYVTEGSGNKWTINSNPAWTYEDKIEFEYQVKAELASTQDNYQKEDFYPLEASVCMSGEATVDETNDSTDETDEDTTDEPDEDPPTGCQADTGSPASNPDQTQVIDDDFTNGPDYQNALKKSLLFYEAQMSGELPAWHRIPWRDNSGLKDGCDVGYDLTGGFYDAGDYVKFHFPQAFTLNVLAWGMVEFKDGYQQAGEWDNASRLLRWGIDHFMKCQPLDHPDYPNIFYGQIGNGDVDHAYVGRPEDMTMERPSYEISASKPGTELAASVSSAFAAAATVFKDTDSAYSAECLKRAREMFEFAVNYKGDYSQSIADAGKFYKSWSGYNDELVLAAAWLARASGDSDDVTQAREIAAQYQIGSGTEFSWDNKTPGANLLMYQITGDDTYKQRMEQWLQAIDNTQKTPNGMYFLQQWGSARHAGNVAFILALMKEETFGGNNAYQLAMDQINYILGDGPQIDGKASSLMVGYGPSHPTTPHHRSSYCPADGECTQAGFSGTDPSTWVLYGALVGGPESATDVFVNDRNNYVANEVALDYNAGLTGVLAAAVQDPGTSTTSPFNGQSTRDETDDTADETAGEGTTDDDSTDVVADEDEPLDEVEQCEDFEGVGELTVYAANPDGGNCGLDWSFIHDNNLKSSTHFVALPKGTYNAYDDHMNCGRCVRFKCSCDQHQFDFACENVRGKEVIAMVTDSCPSCHIYHDLDLSNAAWDEVTGGQSGSRYDGSYEFIPCPSSFIEPSGTRLRFKDGSSQWWTVLQGCV